MPIFCELGLGELASQFSPIIDYLKEIRYEGWVTVEIDQSTSTPYQSLKVCRDFITRDLDLAV
ncbi:sugar phosphate isomerase/epimerase [Geomicrobium halophilum]|uniref:Sugar phosphate isomerase/epimerase n=1 Tax=Geomicrobium halophilum TaxID=549000 RepID=A0A841PU77_9BACL|nr:sugar phosphate isomerase/epimerase [Geomicrobium halophilum]